MIQKLMVTRPILLDSEHDHIQVLLGNGKIDQEDDFTYLGIVTIKEGICVENIKFRISKAKDLFTVAKTFGKI